ncbi:hypothetical protein FJT64_009212 [Amphibalanus amphitrite]|uniref:Uncharacterized protein n=1 Tax=Amphibalanus amphitrite TaxID=1232801 RepID=A0A6A4VN61_AMPAM|nr:hypothetical protein FJT64_009212 [Amphibalanus amphitrite]
MDTYLSFVFQMDLEDLCGELAALRKEVVGLKGEVTTLKGEVATLKGDNATLKGDNATLRQEVVHLREEVVRLRQAVLEERTTRQVVVEELRQEVRRRAAPSDRSQIDGEEVVSLKADTCDKCDATTSCDVTPTTEEMGPASGKRRPPAAREANIYHLDTELLKMVMSKMDCRDMFRARRAATCHSLEKANLHGFKLRVSALRRMAHANASSLRELTLPAGISDWQLEALLEPLKALERLDVSPPVDSSGKWLRLLPKSLKRLDITGKKSYVATLERLDTLEIDDTRPLTDIPALTQSEVASVSRMALACRKLKTLFIKSSAENCQSVLTALHETDLGCDSGQSRTIELLVPKSVLDNLTKPPNGSKISLSYFT